MHDVECRRRLLSDDGWAWSRRRELGASPLTERETAVLGLVESGLTADAIGRELNLSGATMRNYLSNAVSKLDARNRHDAIRMARDAG